MYSIAFVGPKSEAVGLKALGIDVCNCEDYSIALKNIEKFAKSGKFAIIFVASYIIENIASDIEKLKTKTLSIIPVAGSRGGFEQVTDVISGLSKEAIGKEIKIKS